MSGLRLPSSALLGKQVAANPRAGALPAVFYMVERVSNEAVVVQINLSDGTRVGSAVYQRKFFDAVFSPV